MEFFPYLIPHTEINSKWIKALNIRTKTVALLEEHIGQKLNDICQRFLRYDTKGTGNKRAIDKLSIMNIKTFVHQKILSFNRVKRQPTDWEKIYANHISDNGLLSRIYREFLKLNNIKANNPIQMCKELE